MRGRVKRFIPITGIALLTLIVYWGGLKDYLKTDLCAIALEASLKDKDAAERWVYVDMSTSRHKETEPRSFSSSISQAYSSNINNLTIIQATSVSVSSNKSTTTSRKLKDTTSTSIAITKQIKFENIAPIITVTRSTKSQNRTASATHVRSATKTIHSTNAVITLDKLPNRTADDSKRKVGSFHSGNVSSTADDRTAVLGKTGNVSSTADDRTAVLGKTGNASSTADDRTAVLGKTGNASSTADDKTDVLGKTGNGSSIEKERNFTLYVSAHDLTNGRLGNQMFRYASLLGIARAQGRVLIVPSGSDLQNTFKLHHVGDLQETSRWPVISEEHAYAFDKRLLNLTVQNVNIVGYLQSHRYFHDYADEVRQEFVFADSIANEAYLIVHDLISKRRGSLFIGVHLRRGDFLDVHLQKLGYAVPGKSYFLKAFDWMQSKFPNRNITYLVASDDLDWCAEHLSSENVLPLPSASPAVHMAILSTCDHVIMSGGTFGWWSAWLAGGYVIYFKGFLSKGTGFGDTFTPENYYPSLWVGMGN